CHVDPPDLSSFPTRRSSDLGRRGARRVGENHPHLDRQAIPARRAGRTALRDQDQGGGHPWTRIFRMRLFIAGYMALTVTLFIMRSEEHTSELQSRFDLVCRL